MVQVRKSYPQNSEGTLDVNSWLEQLAGFDDPGDKQRLQIAADAAAKAQKTDESASKGERIGCFVSGLEMVSILNELHLDEESIIAAMIYRAVREERIDLNWVKKELGENVAQLITGVLRMAAISKLNSDSYDVLGQNQDQIENVRKMLVAMVDDVRVGLIKLAERTQAIRDAKYYPEDRQRRVAREVFDIYAPLAHRLGIGQIKWELEDLSFRYLQPDEYQKIANMLDGRRIDRQNFIDTVISLVQDQLKLAHVNAEVNGRAKHIYSIWRKMQNKGVSFEQLYDIRAIRIIVDKVSECYSSLGIVHTLWRNIPKEFDDYIANPKPNGYRSLHTAVIGPDSKVFEVQIRTRAMHEEAELGVCAHWLYKGTDLDVKSQGYEQKIEWLRHVLEWYEESGGSGDFKDLAGELSSDFNADRIYVFTPKGHVIDVPSQATPVDFAYHIHTEVGHKCRGAKVDGRIVPLNTQLKNGQQVEVLTGSDAHPNRDWLRRSLGYIHSGKARNKVRAWFKKQAANANVSEGRILLERELKRLALTSVDYKLLANEMNFKAVDDLYFSIGSGDISPGRVLKVAERLFNKADDKQPELFEPSIFAKDKRSSSNAIKVSGVGNLLTTMAKCCKPLPGDQIMGYVSVGRGVTVHRHDCNEFLQLNALHPERVIDVSWGEEDASYPVDITIEAYDRTGLLGDITGLLANMRLNVIAVNTHTDKATNMAQMKLTIEISDIEQLVRLLGRLNNLPNIVSALRST